MIISMLLGLAVGFLMNVPIGPLNLWVMVTTIKKGFLPAMGMAVGAVLIDVLFLFLIASGFHFISPTDPSTGPSSSLSFLWKMFGIGLIFCLGLYEWFRKSPLPSDLLSSARPMNSINQEDISTNYEKTKQGFFPLNVQDHDSQTTIKQMIHCFFLGVILNLSNPTLLITFAGMIGYLKQAQLLPDQTSSLRWIFSFGIFQGAILWFLLISTILLKIKHKMGDSAMRTMQKAASLIMMGSALVLLFHSLISRS